MNSVWYCSKKMNFHRLEWEGTIYRIGKWFGGTLMQLPLGDSAICWFLYGKQAGFESTVIGELLLLLLLLPSRVSRVRLCATP